jgi:hypothetical protein
MPWALRVWQAPRGSGTRTSDTLILEPKHDFERAVSIWVGTTLNLRNLPLEKNQ